jgi:hypothetical protein
MAYGKPKITSDEIKQELMAEIEQSMLRNSDFSSGNLSFYGYSAQWEVNVVLQARGPESEINVIGSKSREQQLEPGEAPPVSRRQYIEQWLANMEAGDKEIDADTLTDFIDHCPTGEPQTEAKLVKAKGKKVRGESKGA